jgi:transposase
MAEQPGFWSVEDRLRELSEQGDPLEKLTEIVDFEMFRPVLAAALGPDGRPKGGRPSIDPVLKFRMLFLQAQHGLSLERTEHLVRDRLSWMRFCGLTLADPVPDANTLWDFREALIKAGALDKLFARLDQAIKQAGYLPMSGQIVDASLVAAPRQRSTEPEKEAIKAGWSAFEIWPDKPAKAVQKDTDARWTVKTAKGKAKPDGNRQADIAIPVFGYSEQDRRAGGAA